MMCLERKESMILEMRRDMTQLEIEIVQCEKWIDRARDTMNGLVEALFDIEDEIYEEKFGNKEKANGF